MWKTSKERFSKETATYIVYCLAAMEKYSKPEDKTSLGTKSKMQMSEKQSEIDAEFAKEEKTLGNNEEDKNEENEKTRLEECGSEKRMEESCENNSGARPSEKQPKGRSAEFYKL